MPTGLTEMIDEDPNLSTAKWVTEGLSRQFGVCANLRDSNRNLTEDEIEEYLKNGVERGTKYHLEELLETREAMEKLIDNPEAWSELYHSVMDEREKSNARNIEKTNIIRACHQRVKEDLIKLRDNTKDDVTRNIAEYGLNQLEITKGDTEPHISVIHDFEEFKSIKLASFDWNIRYHTENIEKIEKRERERLLIYQKIRSEVAEILG